MIVRELKRGQNVAPLLSYLYGPGRRDEHVDPHLVAGFPSPAELEPRVRPDGGRDFRHLTGVLMVPVDAQKPDVPADPVWHCVARTAPGDRVLSDQEWATIASQIMHEVGLAPRGQDDDAVRWIAVRHAADHVHLVATLARQDLRRVDLWRSHYKLQAARRGIEREHGLKRAARGDRTAAARPTRAEHEQAARRGLAEPVRVTLRRRVTADAAAVQDEAEFFAALRASGVLVRIRHHTHGPGHAAGYAVALPGHTTAAGGPVWFGGGKLAPDLSLPKLRSRWAGTSPLPERSGRNPQNPQDVEAVWEHAARAVAEASARIGDLTALDPARAADAAWATTDVLHSAWAVVGGLHLQGAADAYDRAAREPYGRIPARSRTGDALRDCARSLARTGVRGAQDAVLLRVLGRIIHLLETIAGLRHAQHRPAQAIAASAAARHVRNALPAGTVPVATLAAASLPEGIPLGLVSTDFPAPAPSTPQRPGRRRPPHRPAVPAEFPAGRKPPQRR